MVYYKFLCPEDFGEKLKNYKGRYTELFQPEAHSGEKYCYVELPDESSYQLFVKTFGADGELTDDSCPEWPGSLESTLNNRITLFTIIQPRTNQHYQ